MSTTPASGLNLERGFLPVNEPLQSLPKEFAALEQMGAALPKLLLASSPRKTIEELPRLPLELLQTRDETERAMMVLSFIGHGWVWGEHERKDVIPACLAKPWYELSQKLGRPPILSYASYALYNWSRLDSKKPVELGNIGLLQNFLGGIDEEWFVLIHIDIEMLAAPALKALLPAQAAALSGNVSELEANLQVVADSLEKMNATMGRMPEHCDPYIYFNRVRPYIHGWKNSPYLPKGLIYEGVDAFKGEHQQFRGETGSQSGIIPCFDAALGLTHKADQLAVFSSLNQRILPPIPSNWTSGGSIEPFNSPIASFCWV